MVFDSIDAAKLLVGFSPPYLIFLGGADDREFAKTAHGLRDWAPECCLGEWSSDCAATIGLPTLNPRKAAQLGARSMVIGVANPGGAVREEWIPVLLEALDAGLAIISGMHGKLADNRILRDAAAKGGGRLVDVRTPPPGLPLATGQRRSGKRLLTVGTDCALGKKYTALSIARAFKNRGLQADFRATGQTGILIAGSGIPMDAVVSDFLAGAAELLSPSAPQDHWDVIEGQGSLFHPAYAGVALGLLHGSQPDVIVMCHKVGRDRLLGLERFSTPQLEEAIELTLQLARLTNPHVRCGGVSINTAGLTPEVASELEAKLSSRLGIPVADPMREGSMLQRLIEGCLSGHGA